jgi:hypothetical protein
MKVLTEQDYVDEHRHLFHGLHRHDGVWWNQVFPGYAKPAFEFRALVPGSARPAKFKSLFGYRHQVPELAMGNQTMEYMVLEGEDLRRFGMDRLGSKTRNQVRKGLKLCQVREIADLDAYLEDAREVCISHSKRLADYRESYHVHHSHFVEHADSWRAQMRRDFVSKGRTWWGAFCDDRLVGYMVMLQVEDVIIIEKMKLHVDGLPRNASDAIYFTALENATRNQSCNRILNSAPQRGSLDRFKMHFLFKPTPLPFYTSNLALHKFAARMVDARAKLLDCFRARKWGGQVHEELRPQEQGSPCDQAGSDRTQPPARSKVSAGERFEQTVPYYCRRGYNKSGLGDPQ